ncbi:MAG TPA: hypothetical protein PKM41_09715 [Deltaproteobacteria bacterium]|jgi:hypothetical protein|nr:hypothetical protein [Deltaproteobacteria bacterium]HOI07757.1 hypothetical protein [Deltaproteobacteria bacterium]
MDDGLDFLQRLIGKESGHAETMQTIRDIEGLLERLTRDQDNLRNDSTITGRKMKGEIDHLVRLIISGATVLYAKELKGAL